MLENIATQLLSNNFLIQVLPFVILVHVIVGSWAAILQKKFDLAEVANYMKTGALFLLFLLLVDFIYYGFVQSDIAYIVVTGVETLRGASWFAVVLYYGGKLYKNFRIIGMPKLNKVEEELERHMNESED